MRRNCCLAGALAVMMVLSGCGTSVCADVAHAHQELEKKGAGCSGVVPLPSFNEAQCEQNISECTTNDRDRLSKKADCYREIVACDAQSEQSFATALDQCEGHVVSNDCEAAIF
jgi:hypothetical protein